MPIHFPASRLSAIIALCLASAAHAAPFTNLDFEQATFADPTSIFQPWETALPGWQHSDGADTGNVYWQTSHLGLTQMYWLQEAGQGGWLSDFPFEGRYGVFFKSGLKTSNEPEAPWVHAYLAQTGTLDADVRSLHFLAQGPVQLTLDGVVLPLIDLGNHRLAADVTAFAGRTVELRFTDLTESFAPGVYLDGIRLSASAVPEPAGGLLALTGMACMGLLVRGRQRMRG